MPIFVSRFSSDRTAGANLQLVRPRQNQTARQAQAGRAGGERRAGQNRQTNRQEQVGRVRENLLERTQQGERLSQALQNRRAEQEAETTRTEAQPATTVDTAQADRGEERAVSTPRRLPGVGAVRTQADRDVERPGRLRRAPANPAREQALDRFSSLRATAGRGDRTEAAAGGQTARANVGAGTAQGLDARIRLLAANNQGRAGQALARVAEAREERGADGTGQQTAVERLASEPAVIQTAQPTAVEISRANTTPEIQENLEADTREVGQGLQRDAVRQTQLNTRQTVQSAERAAEARQAGVSRESRAQVRALRTSQRQLERELRATQQEIRAQEIRAQQAQNPANRSTVATAAQIGSNLNILAG